MEQNHSTHYQTNLLLQWQEIWVRLFPYKLIKVTQKHINLGKRSEHLVVDC